MICVVDEQNNYSIQGHNKHNKQKGLSTRTNTYVGCGRARMWSRSEGVASGVVLRERAAA